MQEVEAVSDMLVFPMCPPNLRFLGGLCDRDLEYVKHGVAGDCAMTLFLHSFRLETAKTSVSILNQNMSENMASFSEWCKTVSGYTDKKDFQKKLFL